MNSALENHGRAAALAAALVTVTPPILRIGGALLLLSDLPLSGVQL